MTKAVRHISLLATVGFFIGVTCNCDKVCYNIKQHRGTHMRTLKELWLELYEVQKDQEALDKFMDSLTDEEYQLIPIKIRLEYYKQFDFTA